MTKFAYFLSTLKFLLKSYNIEYVTEICNDYKDCFLHWIVEKNNLKNERKLNVSTVFKNYVKECIRLNYKYVLFPVILHEASSVLFNEYKTEINLNHIVIFIYNTNKKTLEYFDSTNNDKYYDAYLLPNIFVNYINNNFKQINTKNLIIVNEYKMSHVGIQGLQEKELQNNKKKLGETIGLCGIYIIWFIEKRLLEETNNPNNIINEYIKNNDNLTLSILNYKTYLDEIYTFNVKLLIENKEYYENKYIDICMLIDLIHECEENINKNIINGGNMLGVW